MSQVQTMSPLLFGENDGSSTAALRWLSPALIGLTAPLVAGLMLVPSAIENARPVVVSLLAVLMIVCVAAYTVSVLSPSVPTGLLVDRESATIEILSQGLLASRSRLIDFDDIVDLDMVRIYDDDGCVYETAQLSLRSGDVVALPVSMTAADMAAARRALRRDTHTPAARRR